MMQGESLLRLAGGLATSTNCCCCNCSGDSQPTNFSATWLGLTFEGDLSTSNASLCAFSGCDRIVEDPYEVMQDTWIQDWCDEYLFAADPPKDANGFPLPREGTSFVSPHCGGEDGIAKFQVIFRERYKVFAIAYMGEVYTIEFDTSLIGNQIHITARIEMLYLFRHAEGVAYDRQYKYVYNTLPGGECGDEVKTIFYSHYGDWTDVADQIDISAMSYWVPVLTFGSPPSVCGMPGNMVFTESLDTEGMVTKQSNECLYVSYSTSDPECPCESFYDVRFYLAADESPALAWYLLQNRARGMFSQFSYDDFIVCGDNVFSEINAAYNIQADPPSGPMVPYLPYDELCSLTYEVTTIIDGDPVVSILPPGVKFAEYEATIPCNELLSGAIELDLVSSSTPSTGTVYLNIPHDLPCTGVDGTYTPANVGIPFPTIPETMTITFTRVVP